ncbi:hypothetical protein EIP91_004683 [Steccherinum ochraceum]|uniref:Uncharacterized protein n=1 Tax=Steccherinum ochraceum TaxID=92696 RepID=A0A4R0REK3_9APHY|nr:hypothetical protein EIP91_004683 [Steccherinum ochraceum]
MPMLDMQNPNQSILSLFDPLRNPATPGRDATTSPEPSSDKENDGPVGSAGQVTVFFNRVYKRAPHHSVKTPKGKLIDYDTTVFVSHSEPEDEEGDDEDMGEMILEGLDDDLENRSTVVEDEDTLMQDEKNVDEDTIQIPVSRRQPLADIQLDSVLGSVPEPEPVVVAGSPNSSMLWDEPNALVPAISAAPSGAPLASVINSINFASLSLHSPDSSRELFGHPFGHPATPRIAVTEAESSHTSPVSQTPQRLFGTHLSSSPSTSTLVTRRLSPTTSATDPRRASVDLQSSFRLQLQNAEMSFDLLNDKISFLGHDSFWTGADDDSVDYKKEEQAMMAIAEECEAQSVPATAPAHSSVFALSSASPPSVERRSSLPLSPQVRQDVTAPIFENASEDQAVRTPDRVHEAPEVVLDPTSQPTAPIPALRIVKKSWKMHSRLDSVSSVTSTVSSSSESVSSTSSSQAESVPAKRPAPTPCEEQRAGKPPVPEMQKARTVIKGLQRPPPGAQLPPMTTMGPAKMRVPLTGRPGAPSRPGGMATGKMGPPSAPPHRPAGKPTSTFGAVSRLTGFGNASKTTSGIPATTTGTWRAPRAASSSSIPARSALPIPQSRIPSAPGPSRGAPANRLPTGSAAGRRIP